MEWGDSIAVRLIQVAVSLVLAFCMLLWAVQELLIFPGTWMTREVDPTQTWGARVQHQGVWITHRGLEHGRAVLITHGNAATVPQMEPYADVLNAQGWGLISYEYRGFAGSAGWPTEARLRRDGIATLQFLAASGVPPQRTVLHGRSVGGGVAGTLLDAVTPAGLVLESTFDNLPNVIRDRSVLGRFPVRWLLRSTLRTDEALASHPTLPVLSVHDRSDRTVRVERGDALFDSLDAAARTRVRTDGHRHGTALVLVDREARATWLDWMEQRVPR